MLTNRYLIVSYFERQTHQQRRWSGVSFAGWLFLLFSLSTQVLARTIYVSSSEGDDARTFQQAQNAATPWKTITKLNSSMSSLTAGDTVLFRRGDTFVGQLNIGKSGNAARKIVFSAYSSGANPIITGAVKLGQSIAAQSSTWDQVPGTNIWRTYYKTGSLRITQLLVDGDRKWIARYPNEGYLYADQTGTRNSLVENDLGKPASYFTGSMAAVRWYPDAWTNFTVNSVTTGAASSTVTFTSSVRDPIKTFGGYYFYGSLQMLDAPNEWFFNDAVDSVYYMPPAGINPNTLTIEASLYDYNINTNGNDYLHISDLTLIRAAASGVLFQSSDNVVFDHLTVQEAYFRGFFSGNGAGPQYVTTYCTISNCTITDCVMGILLWRTSNTQITGNLIKRIGLKFPGFVQSYSADAIQTDINPKLNRYAYNRIDSTSKNGICINDSASVVERNVLTNMGFHTADLGGIYTGGSNTYGLVVRNNFMSNFRTNNESWGEPFPDSYKYLNPGIYNDRRGINNTWSKNTIFNNGMGMQNLNETGSTFYKNIMYGNRRSAMNFVESGVAAGSTGNHNLIGNVLYKTINESTYLLGLGNNTPNWFHYVAKSDSNYFCSPYRPNPIGGYSYKVNDTTIRYETITLATYRSKLNDQTSRISPFAASASNPDQSRLFINPNDSPLTVTLSADTAWFNLDSTRVYGTITIEPWYRQVLVGIPLPKPPTPIITVSPNRTSLTQGTSDKLTLEVTNCPGKVVWQNGTGYGQNNRFIDLLANQPVGSYTFSATCQPDTRTSDAASISLEVVAPSLKIQLKDGDGGQQTNNQLKPELQLQNVGQAAVPLSELTLRYWFTTENYASINTFVDWAQVGTANVKTSYVRLAEPRQGADGYVEYRFDAPAGSLAANAVSGPIQSRIAKQTWTDFDESNDYSYRNTSSFVETDKVTLYRNGVLIWGKEPAFISTQVSLKVASENKNTNTSGNTLSTYLKLTNTGNVPVAYKDIAVRYWFTAEGTQALNYWVDWAQVGASQVKGQYVRLTPVRSGADTYFEIRIDSTLGNLEAHSTTGNIQYRIAKTDWSAFNESDDYSWKTAGAMGDNEKITVYYKGQLVYGTEPSAMAGSRLKAGHDEDVQLVAFPNPTTHEVYVRGGEGAIDVRFQSVSGQQVLRVQSQFGQAISVDGLPAGLYLMQVDTPQGRWSQKLLKQ